MINLYTIYKNANLALKSNIFSVCLTVKWGIKLYTNILHILKKNCCLNEDSTASITDLILSWSTPVRSDDCSPGAWWIGQDILQRLFSLFYCMVDSYYWEMEEWLGGSRCFGWLTEDFDNQWSNILSKSLILSVTYWASNFTVTGQWRCSHCWQQHDDYIAIGSSATNTGI